MTARLLGASSSDGFSIVPRTRTMSASWVRSKRSSSGVLLRPVTMSTSSMPARTASSTTYWIAGLSTIGSISFGVDLLAGRKRVPSPAAGMTALVTGALMSATLVGSVRRDGLRDAPLVASLGLRDVEREVGRTDERRGAVAVVGVDGDADRDGDGEVGRGA